MAMRSYNLNHCLGAVPKPRLVIQDLADTWQPATQICVPMDRTILDDHKSLSSYGWPDKDVMFDC